MPALDSKPILRGFLVVAMLVEQLEVVVASGPTVGHRYDVVDFPAVIHREEQAAALAAPILSFE